MSAAAVQPPARHAAPAQSEPDAVEAVEEPIGRHAAAPVLVPDGPPPITAGGEIAPGYTVVQHLRRGEDYDTYDAWSHIHHCHTVVKVLRPDLVGDPRTKRGLLREAKLLRSLRHPYIVRLLDLVDERGPAPVLVLESLPGGTLSDAIEGYGRFPETALAHLGQQLGSALRYLHERGRVHCDVKPSNIVISAGVTRVIDLALARAPGPAPAEVGSARYMAPEQVVGGSVTPATDVWAVGVVLHEAAAGVRPFPDGVEDREATGSHSLSRTDTTHPRADLGRVYPQLLKPAPRLRSRRRLPVRVASVLDGCLLVDPSSRPSLAEVHAALDTLL
ncbi:serine/threonine-protein kinase [Pseudonocardia oroxyli]|uniref:non-specific serine/threonine protein kinase n=1 Tax=Pseudonocardia oroxyli TaxID=366584 RepID=A0A1G8BGK1_PSEOR|nr:serine/threonine-protein kinase [Pseudonocardia oroxyli]SDH32298.1 Serine/threonine protein kinase [Pseudonocardia oroxyli]